MESIEKLGIEGCFTIVQPRYFDERGYFTELYNENKLIDEHIGPAKQVSLSVSKCGVLRGLHCSQYTKFVGCLRGKLIDFVVDLRPSSSTYKKWICVELSAENKKQMLVPAGCGHGFLSLEEDTMMCYIQGGCYDPKNEKEVSFFDPQFNIIIPDMDYIISEKDRKAANFSD